MLRKMEGGDRYGTGKSLGDGQGKVVVDRLVSLLRDYTSLLPSIITITPTSTPPPTSSQSETGISLEIKANQVWDLIKAVSNTFLEVSPIIFSSLNLLSILSFNCFFQLKLLILTI
jgi:hypothetical protein